MRRAAKVDANQAEIIRGVWRCLECGCERPATAHQMRATYCSRACMSAAYRKRMLGDANPNHRGAGLKTCKHCGREFHSYQKTRKFCSKDCHNQAKPKIEFAGPPKPTSHQVTRQMANMIEGGASRKDVADRFGVKPTTISARFCKHNIKPNRDQNTEICAQCGAKFLAPYSARRKFCSYQCFLDSGGARRAGDAAAMAKRKYGAKKDANHNEVMEAIRKITAVHDLSSAGFGCPDGIAWINGGWQLFDIKNPKTGYGKRGLNNRQKQWIKDWRGGPVYLIYSVEEALRFARGDFDGLKLEESGCEEAVE